MWTLTLSRVPRYMVVLIVWGLLMLVGQACHGGAALRKQSVRAYTLPPTRTAGSWTPPGDPVERQRLNAVLDGHFASFQDCMWRYAGWESSRMSSGLALRPLVATFGVDEQGRIVWLEMDQDGLEHYSLRECISERLVKLSFEPPPNEPVMLQLVLPQFSSRYLTRRQSVSRHFP